MPRFLNAARGKINRATWLIQINRAASSVVAAAKRSPDVGEEQKETCLVDDGGIQATVATRGRHSLGKSTNFPGRSRDATRQSHADRPSCMPLFLAMSIHRWPAHAGLNARVCASSDAADGPLDTSEVARSVTSGLSLRRLVQAQSEMSRRR